MYIYIYVYSIKCYSISKSAPNRTSVGISKVEEVVSLLRREYGQQEQVETKIEQPCVSSLKWQRFVWQAPHGSSGWGHTIYGLPGAATSSLQHFFTFATVTRLKKWTTMIQLYCIRWFTMAIPSLWLPLMPCWSIQSLISTEYLMYSHYLYCICIDFVLMVYWWCIDGVLMVYWWCIDGVLMVYWWCIDGVLMVHWWCIDGVLMVYWWCIDGVFTCIKQTSMNHEYTGRHLDISYSWSSWKVGVGLNIPALPILGRSSIFFFLRLWIDTPNCLTNICIPVTPHRLLSTETLSAPDKCLRPSDFQCRWSTCKVDSRCCFLDDIRRLVDSSLANCWNLPNKLENGDIVSQSSVLQAFAMSQEPHRSSTSRT